MRQSVVVLVDSLKNCNLKPTILCIVSQNQELRGREVGEGRQNLRERQKLSLERLGTVHHLACGFLIFQRLVCISLRPGFSQKPSLTVYEFDRSWHLCQKQIHHIEGLNYGHDFVLLPDYYVFHMTPFVKGSWWIATKILLGWSSPGDEMRYHPELPSRFVIIPRHGSGDSAGVMFVDTEPCHVSLK